PSGDMVTGGAGADWFVLRAPSYGVDTLTDFSRLQGDLLVLDHTGFGLAGTGSLPAAGGSLVHGLTPRTLGPTILESQGNVYWDPDGVGASPAAQLAHVDGIGTIDVVANPGTSGWSVAAGGDFNHDGIGDLLWKNGLTGATSTWLMANGTMVGNPATPAAGGWDVATAAEFNGGGTTDLLWKRAASGLTSEWLMINGAMAANPGTPGALGWNLLASRDFSGDGIADLLWKNASSGTTSEWVMAANGGVAAYPSTPGAQGW